MGELDILSQRQERAIESIERVHRLLRDKSDWRNDPVVQRCYEQLGVIEARLKQLRAPLLEWKREVKSNSIQVAQLKERIRKAMFGPVRFAKKEFRGLPDLLESCRVPHKRAGRDEVARAARAFAKTIRPYMAEFRARRYPKNLPAELSRLAKELERLPDISEVKGVRGKGLREAADLTREGRQLIDELDGALAPTLADRSRSTGSNAWRAAARLRPRLGRPRKKKREDGGEGDLSLGY